MLVRNSINALQLTLIFYSHRNTIDAAAKVTTRL